jgi:eukaryotic-like serine/threonine-protein kinase
MLIFFFTGLSATALLMEELAFDHRWLQWRGTFDEVLPYLRDAFGRVIETFANQFKNEDLKKQLTDIARELCDPDPALRGDPTNRARGSNPFSLERYVTKFDLLSRRAAAGYFREP